MLANDAGVTRVHPRGRWHHEPYRWDTQFDAPSITVHDRKAPLESHTFLDLRKDCPLEPCRDVVHCGEYCINASHKNRRMQYLSNYFVAPGNYVIVEGDGGLDMTLVLTCIKNNAALPPERYPHVIRDASVREIAWYQSLGRYEDGVLNYLNALRYPHDVTTIDPQEMRFLGCEFQFDCKKLYVYFTSAHYPSIRELAKVLHRRYPCRIWCHHVPQLT